VSENTALRRIFGPKREKMAGGWRRLHNKELHNFFASPNIFRVIKSRMRGTCGTHGRNKFIQYFFFVKPEGKMPL
jgi:hypothetical protein